MNRYAKLVVVTGLLLPAFGVNADKLYKRNEQQIDVAPPDEAKIRAAISQGGDSAATLVREAVNAAATARVDEAKAKALAIAKKTEVEKEKVAKLIPLSEIGNRYIARNMVFPIYQKHDRNTQFCLPSSTYFRIGEKQDDGYIAITIESYPTVNKVKQPYKNKKNYENDGLELECHPIQSDGSVADIKWANSEIAHVISADALAAADFKRRGATFGVLAVPFKYYLGDKKKLSVSATVAPYLGFAFEGRAAMRYAPFVSAGLGLIAVEDSTSKTVETKPALSTAVGLLITSAKNPNWSTGLVFGKDFLGNAARAGDNTVGDGWVSIFVGTTLK